MRIRLFGRAMKIWEEKFGDKGVVEKNENYVDVEIRASKFHPGYEEVGNWLIESDKVYDALTKISITGQWKFV